MTLALKSPSEATRPRLATLRLIVPAFLAMTRAFRNRRAALHIADLPDEMLSDIGLKRDDVHAALKAGWREDPTYRLAVVARGRRRH